MIAPLLRQLSDGSIDQEILVRQGKELLQQQQQQQQRYTGGAGAPTPGAAVGPAALSGDHTSGVGVGVAADGGIEAAKINVDRQILLTTLLAHMCASNDATPRTFVEQVRGMGEGGGRVREFWGSTSQQVNMPLCG